MCLFYYILKINYNTITQGLSWERGGHGDPTPPKFKKYIIVILIVDISHKL